MANVRQPLFKLYSMYTGTQCTPRYNRLMLKYIYTNQSIRIQRIEKKIV